MPAFRTRSGRLSPLEVWEHVGHLLAYMKYVGRRIFAFPDGSMSSLPSVRRKIYGRNIRGTLFVGCERGRLRVC